jgi:putative methyltransferase (TIGR04325 family)
MGIGGSPPSVRKLAWALGRGIGRFPPILAMRCRRYERVFATAQGHVRMFRGIYRSFAEAAATVPASSALGYNNSSAATRLEHERHRVVASDYPVMFWLERLLRENERVFDFGGNVGISYFGYRRHLQYPPGLRWTICDLPAVVERGRTIARDEVAPGLEFTSDREGLAAADILLAAGVLHFLEDPIAFIADTPTLPDHLLFNKLPLHDGESVLTLHSIGSGFCPYHLLNRQEFVAAVERRGFECVDAWQNHDVGCYVPFHSEFAVPTYSGFYFRRAAKSIACGGVELRSARAADFGAAALAGGG